MNQDYLGQTFGLAGRTALVTGGARGLGYAIAAGLGRAGARVVINDLSQAACDAACTQLAAAGITARSAVFDVADGAAVAEAVALLEADGVAIDVLVSNAGNQNRKPVIEMTPAEWQALQNVPLDTHIT